MRTSPLDTAHRRAGAKMVPFGGWDMPLEYSGTIDEHLACRADAVVFDVSHLGTVRLTDPDAFDRLQDQLTNDLTKIGPGRAQYTHLLDGDDGSVLDDIIVWWHPDATTFDVMPNASNTDRVLDAVGGEDITHTRAVLAVQGPRARDRLTDELALALPGRFRVATLDWEGTEVVVAGTGYTGESRVEIAVPADRAESLWDAVLAAGVRPAGLGARDTLRLEAGLPLHGNELGPGITPVQAGLGWVIGWNKAGFRGRPALEALTGTEPALAAIATEGRRPPRSGCAVFSGGREVGSVTSGNFSPVLGHGVALALLEPSPTGSWSPDTEVEVEVRGTRLAGRIVTLPFV